MRYVVLCLGALVLITGCGEVRDFEEHKILVATKNLKVVGENLKEKPATKPHGEIVEDQADLIEFAIDPTPEELAAAEPTVDKVGLEEDAEKEAAKSREDKKKAEEEITKKREEGGWWGWLTSATFWATTGGILLTLIKVGSKFTPYGPLVNAVLDPVVERIPILGGVVKKSKEAEKTIGTLAGTVEGSLLGRYGLQAADKLLKEKFGSDYGEAIYKMSDGHATSTEELFKWLAKTHVVDSPEHDHRAVDKKLDEIKTSMHTVAGVPAALKDFLANASKPSS